MPLSDEEGRRIFDMLDRSPVYPMYMGSVRSFNVALEVGDEPGSKLILSELAYLLKLLLEECHLTADEFENYNDWLHGRRPAEQ